MTHVGPSRSLSLNQRNLGLFNDQRPLLLNHGLGKSPNNTVIQGTEDGSVRKGKWSIEEENFANRLIFLFNKGLLLDVLPNQTLRTYLSEKLNCDPMRITKKFSGVLCIGKQVFQSNIQDQNALENAKKYNAELQKLEVRNMRH